MLKLFILYIMSDIRALQWFGWDLINARMITVFISHAGLG